MLNLNKELKESMITNKLIINITEDDYHKINNTINKLRNKYQNEFKKVMDCNNRSLETMNFHCNLIKKIIYDVINEFDIIKKYDVCAFITGSFARCSNKKNSDIDFQLAFPQEYKMELFKYEEMIYYIISSIVGLNRSSVHSMLITRLSRENIDYLKENLDDCVLTINLHSTIGDISYEYNANTKRRIYLQYGNDNSLENVFEYLKYEVKNNNKEWSHIFYVFSMKEEFAAKYNLLYEYEKSIISSDRITNRIDRIRNKILQISQLLDELDMTNISNVKLIYQKKEFAILNEYISYKRDIALINNIEWEYINYYDNKKFFSDDEIFIGIINYLFLIFNTAEPLGKKYSLHSNEKVILKNYNDLRSEIININNKILNNLKEGEKIWKE